MAKRNPKANNAPAKPNAQMKRFCGLRDTPPRTFGPHVGPARARAIVSNEKKWVNGTHLNYFFFNGPNTQKQAMRRAFKVWTDVGIGITFGEVNDRDEAQIRIAFANDGSWSYLGREILTIAKSEPTMNIGWDISGDLDTGVHEIGHALAMPHEHQNPNAGIVWNEQAVYDALAMPPNNWDRQTTFWNIIRKIPANEVAGTNWDPDSIMHYPFGAGLILKPAHYAAGLTPAGGLSKDDIAWIRETYPKKESAPKSLKPLVLQPLKLDSGEQAAFTFQPSESRRYKLKTFGESDSVMVLFEEGKKQSKYMTGIDDSGEDKNGEIEIKLEKGKSYLVRVRMLYKMPESECALMVW